MLKKRISNQTEIQDHSRIFRPFTCQPSEGKFIDARFEITPLFIAQTPAEVIL